MATTNEVSSSSSSRWQNFSTRITTSLASALLEWLLISFLFVSAIFSYVITKFANYCKLKTPCLFCSRLDHVLGKQKRGYYLDLICNVHKSEISELVFCRAHDKLVNIQGVCETCVLSSASVDKSNAESSRLLVGEEESGSVFDHDPLLGQPTVAGHCSCCSEKFRLDGHDQNLAFAKSIRSRDVDFDDSGVVGNDFYEKRSAKPSVSFRDARLRNDHADPLSRVGYTELNITSDTESEFEVPISDDDGISVPIHGKDDTEEDIRVPCEYMVLCSVDSTEDLTSGKPGTSASVLEPLLSEPQEQVENKDICAIKTAEATVESGNGLTELDWQQIERSDVCPSPSEPVSFNDVHTLSNITEVPVEVSKEKRKLLLVIAFLYHVML